VLAGEELMEPGRQFAVQISQIVTG